MTPTPTPTPSNLVCKELTAKPNGNADSLDYTLAIVPTGDTSQLTGYHFAVVAGNGTTQTVDSDKNHASIDFTFAAAGTYTINGQVVTAAGAQAQVAACSALLTVGPSTQTPAPSPSPGQTLGTSTQLPATGPESALAGVGGLSAIGYATRSYLRSRKSLLSSLKKRK